MLLLLPAACAYSEATPDQGHDGQAGWIAVSCRKSQSNCYEMAGEVCPAGYVTADQEGHAGVAVSGIVTPSSGFVGVHPTYHGDMLIKCRGVVEVVQTTAGPPAAQVVVPQPVAPAVVIAQ